MSVFRRTSIQTDKPGTVAVSARANAADRFSAMPALLTRQDAGAVAVAVDGRAWSALEWAAAEAAARCCLLRVVDATETTSRALAEAVRRARAVAPGVAITTERHRSGPVAATLRAARGDALIVMEKQDPIRPAPFTRSACWTVTRKAKCPVAIVALAEQPIGGSSAAGVVVGIDTTTDPSAALGFAFRSALRRGVGVTLVRAWMPCWPQDFESRADGHTAPSSAAGRYDSELRLWQVMFPEVAFRQRLVAGPLGPALVAESDGAALAIVATALRGRLHRRIFDSVGETVLEGARCPVVIIGQRHSRTKIRTARP